MAAVVTDSFDPELSIDIITEPLRFVAPLFYIMSCRSGGILRDPDDGVKPNDSQDVSLEAAII